MSTSLTKRIAETSPRLKARIAGVFYLLNILTIVSALFCFRGLFVQDPAATATNILAHESSFRLGFACELISTVCSIGVAALFYELFIPVSKSFSLLAAFFRLTGCAVAAVSYVFQLVPLLVLSGTYYLSTFKLEQLQALAHLSLRLHDEATNILIVFFGFHFLVIGCLILRSNFLPRLLGVPPIFFGPVAILTCLAPPLKHFLYPYMMGLGGLTEASLTLWLLVMGVNAQRWNEQASTAGEG